METSRPTRLAAGRLRTGTRRNQSQRRLLRGASRAAPFDLRASLDGATWTTLAKTISSATTLKPETYDVRDMSARYVRLVGRGATGTTWSSVTEMRESFIDPPSRS